jgi:TPR repeat protein
MPAGIRNGLLVIYAVLIMALPAYAETRTFADLLAQAKVQAATGHRWAPPGNNMTETVIRMMDIIAMATPAQLSELSVLLAGGKTVPPPPAPSAGSLTEERPDQAVPAPSASQPSASQPTAGQPSASQPSASQPSASQPSPALALAEPTSPPVLPDRPEPGQNSPIISGQAIPAPGSHAGVLFARGLDAELRGNLSGARRFYLSAADQGDAAAARNLGRLYDPAYLKQTALGGVDPDPALARHWYERAVRLGDTEAGLLLEALSVR